MADMICMSPDQIIDLICRSVTVVLGVVLVLGLSIK